MSELVVSVMHAYERALAAYTQAVHKKNDAQLWNQAQSEVENVVLCGQPLWVADETPETRKLGQTLADLARKVSRGASQVPGTFRWEEIDANLRSVIQHMPHPDITVIDAGNGLLIGTDEPKPGGITVRELTNILRHRRIAVHTARGADREGAEVMAALEG